MIPERPAHVVQGTHVQELEFEDARRHFEESKYLNKRLTELYVKHNTAGKTYEELFETMKSHTFLRAEEAVQHGFADSVVESREYGTRNSS